MKKWALFMKLCLPNFFFLWDWSITICPPISLFISIKCFFLGSDLSFTFFLGLISPPQASYFNELCPDSLQFLPYCFRVLFK